MTCLPMVQAESLEGVLEENDQLRAKIEGLNEEYNKIGLEVFKVRTVLRSRTDFLPAPVFYQLQLQ